MLTAKTVKIGFIGYGNMAGATGRGLVLSGAIAPDQIYACAKNYEKLCAKAETEGIHPCRTSLEIAEKCDIIFIGVKPYMVEEILAPLSDALKGKIVISLATGLYCDTLSKIIPQAHCVATAPNTPVSICEGIFICEEENTLTEEEKSFVQELLENLGLFLWLDKDHMEIAGVIAGAHRPLYLCLWKHWAMPDANTV